MRVFLTIDVEIWCDGWDNLDSKFNSAFQRYIYGPTSKGDYGLPYQLKVLQDHGLTGVFFVEPLFSLRFGAEPLAEISGLINDYHQPIELHLHTEWVDEAPPFLPTPSIKKRQNLRDFSLDDQTLLIGKGKELLMQSGVSDIHAFRAGSFGFNIDTMTALKNNKISIDCSYNATKSGLKSGLAPGKILTQPFLYNNVHEVPMTIYTDRPGNLRHTQLCACSFRELKGLLMQALEDGREDFVILLHNFELLKSSKQHPDFTVINRFRKLCAFLDNNRDNFSTASFDDYMPQFKHQPPPLTSPIWKTGLRYVEQMWSRYR